MKGFNNKGFTPLQPKGIRLKTDAECLGQGVTGFTLVEILVATVIMGLVIAGVYSAYTTQHKTYLVQEQVTEMQQNERAALQMITRDIRLAGLGLACQQAGIILTEDADGSGALNAGEDINGDAALTAFGNGLGYDSSDTIALAYYVFDPRAASAGNTTTAENFNSASANFKVIDTTGFNINDLVIIYNQNDLCNSATVVITNVTPASGTLTHATGRAIENKPGGVGPAFSSGDRVRRLNTSGEGGIITYGIRDGYTLYRTNRTTGDPVVQPLADNIEDLQFAYGFDSDNDGDVDAWVNSLTGQDMTELREIRVTLVARTTKNDPEWKAGARPPAEDHTAAILSASTITTPTQAKQYRRRVLQTTIKLRNIDGITESF